MQSELSIRASGSPFKKDKALQTLSCRCELELGPGHRFLFITILFFQGASDCLYKVKIKIRDHTQGMLASGFFISETRIIR